MNTIMADDGSFYYHIQGMAEGTSYSIIYQHESGGDLQTEIESLLSTFEQSLSVYDSSSIISRINRNEEIETDFYFETVFTKAKEISSLTEGAFDISAEPLFRAWGFSAQGKEHPDEKQIESLKKSVGMDKVIIKDKRVIKSNPNVVLNANAIAKGYSADIVASFLDDRDSENYLVEIGGEIRVKGRNTEGGLWKIGIDRPSETNLIPGQDLQLVLQISNKGLATSGNYRQFYIENGQKIVHTIDPASGYPVKHNLLSTTVIANDALTADAFATAFMVAGIDKALEWIDESPDLDAIFICDEGGDYKVYFTEGIENNIIQV